MHFEVMMELHAGLPQQAPGSDASTRRALKALPADAHAGPIVDAGCGPGRQTLVLARETSAHIVAIDLLEVFVDEARARASAASLDDRIDFRVESMDAISEPAASVRLFWSEGAIYNIGFERGLELWRPLLSRPGWVAVTELCWLGGSRPERAAEFWSNAYPDMTDIDGCCSRAHAAGYQVIERFTLPSEDFWQGYYAILRDRLPSVREKWSGDPEAIAQLNESEQEIALYEHFADSFGYVFFVLEVV